MVDRTAQAFRLKDEPSLGELESGLTSGYRDYTPEDKQTEEAFKPRIDYMSLPAGANPDKDVVVGQTELGEPVYQTMMGTKYSLMTVTPEPKQWETEPRTMARAGEVLKSYATGAAEGIMNAPAEIWESMETLAGTGDRAATYGDVLNLAGLAATGSIPSIARGAIEGVDPNVATIFGGYTGKRTLEEDALGYNTARTKVRQEFVDAYDRFNVIRQELADEKQQQNLFVPEESINYEASQKLWEETGYFVGQDGTLRFEIDDSKAAITPTPLTSVKDFTEARRVISSGTTTTTLKDFLQHDDLYAAYPEIKDLPVFVDRSLAGTNTRGWFDPLAGQLSIALNPELLSNKWSIDNVALSTLLHEIQHYVQNKESFDEGINLDSPELVKIYDAEVSKKRGAEIWDNYEKQKAQFETTLEKTKSNAVSSVIDYYITMLSENYGANAKKLSRAVFDYEGSNKTEEDKKEVRQAVEKAFSPSIFSFFSKNVAPLDLLQNFVDLIRYRDTESQDYVFNSAISRLLKNNKEGFNSHFNLDNVDIKDIVDSFGRFKRDTVGYELFLPKDVQLPERPIFIDSSVPFGPDQIFDIYQRRSGETESRNVQERRKFTAEERARLFPRQTENVLPEYQWTGAEIISKNYAEAREELANKLQRGTSASAEESSVNSIRMPPPEVSQRTQIAGTFPTYEKAVKIFDEVAPEGRSLDYGAGLGKSSELGFDTFEPFAREGFDPTYRSASDIPDASYERVTNLNVLNVVDPDTRRNIVVDIGRVLKPNGVAIITTRGRDVLTAKGERGPEDMSIITSSGTYQKGFTKAELVSYLRDTLGEGFEVSPLNLGPAGAIVKKISSEQGYAQGGMVDYNTETQMNRLMQEGGIADDGMRRDPVSGNEIPPGSMASEVRDDIPAQLSEGEYIVPADVLRYYGVAFFEQLRAKAKRGLAEMEAGGRIGGEPVPMRNGMEMEEEDEDEDELPFDISELETSGDDTDMQMAEMGMAAGGVVKMQEGGVPKSTFSPAQFQTPGSTYFATPTTPPTQQSEYRVYQNAQGQTLSILFVNGVPQQAIPEGYFPQGQAPAVTTPQPQDSSDREDREPQQPAKAFSEYTAQDWMNYRPDTGVGSTIGKIAGGVIGGALLGPAGAMIGGKFAEEGMARNSVSAYNALNDYVATLSRNDPSYAELAEKRNKMYGDLSAAQQENPGFFGNIFNNIFGKPEIAAPKTGTGGARPVATAAPAAAPAATSGRAEPSTQVSSGRGSVQATAPTTPRRAEPSTQISSGRGAVQATVPAASPARTTPRVAQDQRLGAGARGAAKGGLMEKKQKNTQKRKIKTTDA